MSAAEELVKMFARSMRVLGCSRDDVVSALYSPNFEEARRSIKRFYVKAIRRHPPEADPVRFSEIRQAMETALEIVEGVRAVLFMGGR